MKTSFGRLNAQVKAARVCEGGSMKRMLILLTLMSVTALALAGGQESRTPSHRMGAMMMDNCSMKMEGTEVAVVDTPTGVVVTLTTKPDKAADLQHRVQQMIAMHSREDLNAPRSGMMQGVGTLKYEAIENGARLTLEPKDPAQLTEFQTQVRAHFEMMKRGNHHMMARPEKDESDHSSHH
jgi:hypothetical protein